MKLTPVYGAKNPVTCVPCCDTIGVGRLYVATVNDPTSNLVTVTVNGVNYVSGTAFNFTAYGSPSAIFWSALFTINGLANKTAYPWTVTQGSNTDAGTLPTLPASGDTAWTIVPVTCDRNTYTNNTANARPENVAGYWPHIREYAQTKWIAGIPFIDDLGYVPLLTITDNNTSYALAGQSGLATGGQIDVAQTLNAYLIGWAACLGMLGPTQTTYTGTDLSTSDPLLMVLWGREEDRAWCRKNLNQWPGIGDWDAGLNDMGWDVEPATSTAYTNAIAAWAAVWGKVKPKLDGVGTKRDASAHHWAFTIGGTVTIAFLDGITNAARNWAVPVVPEGSGTPTTGDSTQITQFTQIWGNNQIDDIKEAVNTLNGKLTIVFLEHGIRYFVDRTANTPIPKPFTTQATEFQTHTQHPVYDHCIANWKRLVTQKGIADPLKSLMDSPVTRGRLIVAMGDLHRTIVGFCNHEAYNDGTNDHASENFAYVQLTSVGASDGVSPGTITAGTVKSNIEVLYKKNGALQFPMWGNLVDWNGQYLHWHNYEDDAGGENAQMWEGRFYPAGVYGPFTDAAPLKVAAVVSELE